MTRKDYSRAWPSASMSPGAGTESCLVGELIYFQWLTEENRKLAQSLVHEHCSSGPGSLQEANQMGTLRDAIAGV